MTTQHLNKIIAGTLAAMLTCALVPAQALSPIDLSVPKAYADEVSQTRTDQVKAAYLIQNSDGTYRLNRDALTTQEQWRDLGAVGFFLYSGYDLAADILLNPEDHIKLNNGDLTIERQLQMDHLGDSDDATAYDNMQYSIDLVNDWNLTRQYENENGTADERMKDFNRKLYEFKLAGKQLDMLKVSPELIAREMLAVNFSSIVAFEHADINGTINESLGSHSVRYDANDPQSHYNPLSMLYFAEKDAFLQGESLSYGNGHWPTLMSIEDTVSGCARAIDRKGVSGSGLAVYGYASANAKQVTSYDLTVMEIDDYQAKLDAYKAFVESLPSDASSGIDPDTSTGGTTKPTPENTPAPTYAYTEDYTFGADPNGGAAGKTYPTLPFTGSPVTLSVRITDAKGCVLEEGVDYTMTYDHNNEITAKTGYLATWKATDVNKKWSLSGEFILTEPAAEQTGYKWSGKLSAYTTAMDGSSVKIANKAQTFLYNADGTKASIGWHTVDGKRYYCAKEGKPVYVDCTIDGTSYTATWDAASQTYYLVEAKGTTPAEPEKPTEPSKPETPVVTPQPEPSVPDTSEADKRAEEEAAKKKAEEEARKKAEAEAAKKKAEEEAAKKAAAEAAAKKKAEEEAAKKAALAKKNGWYTEGGYRLYYVKGTPLKGWQTISGKTYYFDPKGRALRWTQTISGNTYYFDGNGVMHKGWLTWSKDKSKSYFDSKGRMVKWSQKIGGSWYYFNGAGKMHKGWLTWSNDKSKSYYASNGKRLTGWQKISGKWYYFNSNGKMAKGWLKLSKKWYYLKSNGQMATGWQKISGKWYYFKGGNSGQMLTGWQKISKKWYYFNSSGKMLTGWQKIKGKKYYFKSGGQMVTSWYKIGKYKYYFKSGGAYANKKRRA